MIRNQLFKKHFLPNFFSRLFGIIQFKIALPIREIYGRDYKSQFSDIFLDILFRNQTDEEEKNYIKVIL